MPSTRFEHDCERFCFRVLLVIAIVFLSLVAIFLLVVWAVLSQIFGGSGSGSVSTSVVGSGLVFQQKNLDEWMKLRDIDPDAERLVEWMAFNGVDDFLVVAYRDAEGALQEDRWLRLREEEKTVLRTIARRLWDEILAESWLQANGLDALTSSFHESRVFSLREILSLVREIDGKWKGWSGAVTETRPVATIFNAFDQRPDLRRKLFFTVAHFQAQLLNDAKLQPGGEGDIDEQVEEVAKHDRGEASEGRLWAAYKRSKWEEFMEKKSASGWRWYRLIASILAVAFALAGPLLISPRPVQSDSPESATSAQSPLSSAFFDALTFNRPSASASSVDWDFENPSRVGKTVSFKVVLNTYHGSPFAIEETSFHDWVTIDIKADEAPVLHTTTFSTSPTPTSSPSSTPASTPAATPAATSADSSTTNPAATSAESFPADSLGFRRKSSSVTKEPLAPNVVRVSFTVHRAATYEITVKVQSRHLEGSPYGRVFQPGPMDPSRTGFCQQSPLLTCSTGSTLSFAVQPHDKYNNKCDADDIDGSLFSLEACPVSSNMPSRHSKDFLPVFSIFERKSSRLNVSVYPNREGIFHATLMYLTQPLVNCTFTLVVLSPDATEVLESNITKKKHNLWYEAKILDYSHSSGKPRKVYIYVSPRQVTIKEFYLMIIPKRLFTFRVCPSTKIDFKKSKQYSNADIFSIDDGCVTIDLASKDRDKFVATFARFLLNNVGGSETFQDKRDFFYAELLKHHSQRGRGRYPITIARNPNVFESAYRALKHATTADWTKVFEISFEGEEGLDYGGLRREAFNQIFKLIFHKDLGLFKRFCEDQHGATHPAPMHQRDSFYKTKHFEFAGKLVGKCLYESAQGLTYALQVTGRFTRSFLAQLIGLRINYKYFEHDDPQFFVTKVKYILENNLDDAELATATGLDELTFAEEVYDDRGNVSQVIDLIPNGRNLRVTNSNKVEYLDRLAQHRFISSVSTEIEFFLKGLNDLVPDSLLCIFDERELELLLCGTGNIDIEDFRKNTEICSSTSLMFPRSVEWFWTVVSSFGQEELALLLQFVTGSSQLPPNGFADLRPRFQILHSPAAYNSLPTAHTCFNQLCLPDYEDCATLHRVLLLALHEGSQGFGLR